MSQSSNPDGYPSGQYDFRPGGKYNRYVESDEDLHREIKCAHTDCRREADDIQLHHNQLCDCCGAHDDRSDPTLFQCPGCLATNAIIAESDEERVDSEEEQSPMVKPASTT